MNDFSLLFCFCFQKRASHSFMDVKSLDDIIASADVEGQKGNYKSVIAMLEPLLKGEKKKTLSPSQEMEAVSRLCGAFRFLDNCKAALPHAKRWSELAILLDGKGSKEHAFALQELGLVETMLK